MENIVQSPASKSILQL